MSYDHIEKVLAEIIVEVTGEPRIGRFERTVAKQALARLRECGMTLAEQGEPEWEYGHDCDESRAIHGVNASPQNEWPAMGTCTSTTSYRRRAAGPWLPVPDTTNTESEGKT